jgi:large subunit ribosomal protein L6
MSMSDTIADLLTRIRNAQRADKASVSIPFSKMKHSICKVLEQEGYIESTEITGENKKNLMVMLKYYEGKPVIENIKRISKPGLRIFKSSKQVPMVKNGLGICIVSTSHGVMTDKEAREKNYGGKPIELPENTKFSINANLIDIEGPMGKLSFTKHDNISVDQQEGSIFVKTTDEEQVALSGTTRALLSNMIHGVSKGWIKKLKMIGVGYRAKADSKNLEITVGFSHPVNYPIPEGLKIETPAQTEIVITGIDKQKVGQAAAEIRAYRPPEPYKGKGIRYEDEVVIKKEAKKK